MARYSGRPDSATDAQIIDIRNNTELTPLDRQISAGLNVPEGQEKRLPTLLLYDAEGLQLFEKITYLDEYYLTNEEIGLLEKYADNIAARVASHPDSIIVELGSGNLRKVRILLEALDRKKVPVSYYALDLSYDELKRTLDAVPPGTFEHVKCFGLWGTYDNGREWLEQPENIYKSKTVLSLGSSIGNFNRKEAAEFLEQFKSVLSGEDSFLLAVDGCVNPKKVYHAYNDSQGITHEFIRNGLRQANKLLDRTVFDLEQWEVIGEYDQVAGRHHAFVVPRKSVTVEGVKIAAGERVRIEESYKYDEGQMETLIQAAGMTEAVRWSNTEGSYGIHMLQNPVVRSPTNPDSYAKEAVPSLDEWNGLWTAWDSVTRKMIPEDELLGKPIKLRNACIFYLGHIPTFLDIHLTRSTKGRPTEPSYYTQIFERGIDPDVDDPEKCHSHSEVPDSWPALPEILKFQEDVRARVLGLYKSGQASKNSAVGRALWLGYEHEVMHLETLLYMLVQSEKTLAPPGTIRPDFEAASVVAAAKAVANQWFDIPAQEITIGLDDPGDNAEKAHFYGWDNESPARRVQVGAFSASARPITNGEYAHYLEQTGKDQVPASWAVTGSSTNGTTKTNGYTNGHTNGHQGDPTSTSFMACPSASFIHNKSLRTVYGLVPLAYALHWPVSASYDELSACAAYMGGRIPSLEEARSIHSHAANLVHGSTLSNEPQAKIPAVNGHLSANGVQETPPANADEQAWARARSDLFIDLASANTGFKHWHPVPVTHKGDKLAGHAGMGGLWEWTATPLAPHDGFEAMELYPGYTADFFDGKHNIVLGGSWATLPRVAGRKSFVNWYQRNYPFVWAGARVVRDL